MSPTEFRVLIDELNHILKTREMTYRDLAREMGMSEAGVKRILGSRDAKISTLSKVCNALGFSFLDLVSSSKLSRKKINFFSEEQDQALAENFDLYIFLNELVVRKKSLEQIKIDHALAHVVVERYLLRLEKLEIIKRTANGQIRILLQEPIGIRKGGPLRQKLQEKFSNGLLANILSSGPGKGNQLETREWTMSSENISRFRAELKALIESFDQISARDTSVLAPRELTTLSMMTGLLENSPYGPILKSK